MQGRRALLFHTCPEHFFPFTLCFVNYMCRVPIACTRILRALYILQKATRVSYCYNVEYRMHAFQKLMHDLASKNFAPALQLLLRSRFHQENKPLVFIPSSLLCLFIIYLYPVCRMRLTTWAKLWFFAEFLLDH